MQRLGEEGAGRLEYLTFAPEAGFGAPQLL